LDRYLDFEEWKKLDEDAFYDWMLIRKVSIANEIEKSLYLSDA